MIYPHPPPTAPSQTLNATSPNRPHAQAPEAAAERTARHLHVCQELIEIGMRLARAASQRVLDDLAAPPPVASIPGSSAGIIAQAEERARRRSPDYGRLFHHLSRAVRQAILLETHIAEGLARSDRAIRPPSETHCADPGAERHTPRRESLDRLDGLPSLALDDEAEIEEVLRQISEKFGLDLDPPATPGDHGTTPTQAAPTRPGATLQPHKPAAKNPKTPVPQPAERW